MASKSRSRTQGSDDNAGDASQAIRDSAQKIWLAGLGAFERAKTEGPRMFETLVEQGRNMGARAVGMADDALKGMREANYAGNRWDKLRAGVRGARLEVALAAGRAHHARGGGSLAPGARAERERSEPHGRGGRARDRRRGRGLAQALRRAQIQRAQGRREDREDLQVGEIEARR